MLGSKVENLGFALLWGGMGREERCDGMERFVSSAFLEWQPGWAAAPEAIAQQLYFI